MPKNDSLPESNYQVTVYTQQAPSLFNIITYQQNHGT